jgi:hypothetical protein
VAVHNRDDLRFLIENAIKTDPNAADLWFNLARLRLQAGDKDGYNAAIVSLQRLTPGLRFQIGG